MRIRGAVLEEIGRERPYAQSQPINVCELELDGPGPGELLVRIEAAGVCHSDLSVVDGNRVRPVPMLLGHEACGRVEEIGDAVSGIAVGQRVVMSFLPRCESCAACATGGRVPCGPGSVANGAGTLLAGDRRLHRDGSDVHHHLGVSGFATHAVVDQHSACVVGDDVPPAVAAVLGCAVLTGGGALLNAGKPEAGDTVIVVGLGGVGMAAVLTAAALGGCAVVAVDRVPDKLARAKEFGAQTYTPDELVAAGLRGEVVIEAVGSARAFEMALAVTAPGGRTVTVGLPNPSARAEISPLQLVAEARTIIGSYLGSAVPRRDIPVFAQWWREGRLPVERLISSTIRLDDINTAMDELSEGHAVRQVILFD